MTKTYSTSDINRNWKIKVFGIINGAKVNTLVGVSGLLRILGGSIEKLQKMVGRAFKACAMKVACKLYGTPVVITFYAH